MCPSRLQQSRPCNPPGFCLSPSATPRVPRAHAGASHCHCHSPTNRHSFTITGPSFCLTLIVTVKHACCAQAVPALTALVMAAPLVSVTAVSFFLPHTHSPPLFLALSQTAALPLPPQYLSTAVISTPVEKDDPNYNTTTALNALLPLMVRLRLNVLSFCKPSGLHLPKG